MSACMWADGTQRMVTAPSSIGTGRLHRRQLPQVTRWRRVAHRQARPPAPHSQMSWLLAHVSWSTM
eukprot:8089206-Heterocapsa_arctica.AAC.1